MHGNELNLLGLKRCEPWGQSTLAERLPYLVYEKLYYFNFSI